MARKLKKRRRITRKLKPASGEIAILSLGRYDKVRVRAFPARKRMVIARGGGEYVEGDYDYRTGERTRWIETVDEPVRVNAPNMVFVELMSSRNEFSTLFVARTDKMPPTNDLPALFQHPVRLFHLPNTGDSTDAADVCLGDARGRCMAGKLDPVDAFWNTRFRATAKQVKSSFGQKSEPRSFVQWLLEIGIQSADL